MPATHLGKAATVPYLTSVASPSLLTALCKHSTTEDIKCWAFLHNLGLLVLKFLFSYFFYSILIEIKVWTAGRQV